MNTLLVSTVAQLLTYSALALLGYYLLSAAVERSNRPVPALDTLNVLDLFTTNMINDTAMQLTSLMSDCEHVSPVGGSNPVPADGPMTEADTADDNTVTLDCMSEDLPAVLDRVETPLTVEVGDQTYEVNGATASRFFIYLDTGYDVVNLDRGLCVTVVNPITLDAPSEVVAYGDPDGYLCPEHGAALDYGIEDPDVWPIFDFDHVEGAAVEWCHHAGFPGHQFCTCCGTGVDPDDASGPFARCWNCHTESVYVDGFGYSWCGNWADMLDAHNVEVYGPTVTYVTTNGYTRVTAVEDIAGTDPRKVRTFLGYIDLDPSAGAVLFLAESDEALDAYATDHFELEHFDATDAQDEQEAEGMLSDFRADVRVVEVDRDRMTITSKR